MRTRELRNLPDEELIDHYEDLKQEQYRNRLDHATGNLVDTSTLRRTRKEIARVLTILRERELAAQLVEEG